MFFDTSQRVFEKGFLQGARHNLRGDLARMKVLQRATTHPTTGKIYCKVGGCGLRMIFKYISESLFVFVLFVICYFSIMRCSILSLYNLFVLIRIV